MLTPNKITGAHAGGPRQSLMRSPSEPPETPTAPKRINVGWAIQGACLLVLAAGWLAAQVDADWKGFESSWISGILLAVGGGAFLMEGVIERRRNPQRMVEPGAAPNAGLTTRSGDAGVTEGPLRITP